MRAQLRSTRTLLIAGALLATGAVFVVANAGAGKKTITTPAPIIAGFEDVNFVSQCRFSHRKPDDPIVFPSQPNLSHDHSFFGNFKTDAYSTPQSLLGQRTTCNRTADTAAYWAPTLIVDNKPALTLDLAAYWDGKGLDSPNHKAHMAYADNGVCPADHPVALPQLVLIVRYGVNGSGNVVAASGGQYSGHADFVNAWDEAELTRLVDYCLNALRPCGVQR
jgi:hypothetical protein